MTNYSRYRLATDDPDTYVILDVAAGELLLERARDACRRVKQELREIQFLGVLRY